MGVNLLEKGSVRVKHSSGISKDLKNILDENEETCWSFTSTDPTHSILFQLGQPVSVDLFDSLSIVFAGGFSAISITLSWSKDGKHWSKLDEWFPDDSNRRQSFSLTKSKKVEEEGETSASWLKLDLSGSTDDYGRIIIYQVQISTTNEFT